jgi:hypothetical protein
MQFEFSPKAAGFSGYLAFTGPPSSRLLLVTDAGHCAVHVIDVVNRTHVGYVGAPGSMVRPRGVAARGSLVAVSSWPALNSDSTDTSAGYGYLPTARLLAEPDMGNHLVHVFEGGCDGWVKLRVIGNSREVGCPGILGGHMVAPCGLRFSRCGTQLAVACHRRRRVTVFRVADGALVQHLPTAIGEPLDVEEGEHAGVWLAVCRHLNHVLMLGGIPAADFGGGDGSGAEAGGGGGGGGAGVGEAGGTADGADRDELPERPLALTLVPGLGLAVRGEHSITVLATRTNAAMASMSSCRVGWMSAVARGACGPQL